MAWAKNGTPDTLSSADHTLTISDLTAKKFNFFMAHFIADTDSLNPRAYFNADQTSVYATRYNPNGTGDGTASGSSMFGYPTGGAYDGFRIFYVCSISGEEKLVTSFLCEAVGTGAANDPERYELVHKYVPSPDADITEIECDGNSGSQQFGTGSNLSALGAKDTALTSINIQDGTIFEETDTNKSYIWSSSSQTWT